VRFNYDPAHSGSMPAIQTINAATVGGLHQLWRTHLEVTADSAPVYLHALVFPDHHRHDVLYVTTKNGTLLALDAGTGRTLWRVHTHGPQYTTASPAADPSRRYVYFYGLDGFVHKVGASDGKEIKTGGWPVRITFIPAREKGSAPLSVVNGRLYAAVSTFAPETPPNQGHLVVIDLANASTHVFNTVCSNIHHVLAPHECATSGAGIWARATAVVDPVTGNVFISTANGPYDGRRNWGDSVLELSADGTHLIDSFTPVNQAELDDKNWDLGSTGPALLPQIPGSKTPSLLVQGGKDGVLHLLNRQNLSGRGGPGHVGGEVQVIDNPACTMFTQPAVWQESNQGATWVFTADICGMTGYQVVTDQHQDTRLRQVWHLPVVTTSPLLAGGVLFAASKGALLALDPRSGQQLWSSTQPSADGTLGAIHWESPIVVGGKVYVTDESGAVVAYGLP
jgi:outer membrane protein assembly factor BamB